MIGDAVYIADFDDHRLHYPQEVGTATIEVSTDSQVFGNEIFITRAQVEVKAIIVSVDPAVEVVEPGDLVTFRARVNNADDQSVTWHTTAGYFDVATTSTDGNNEAILVTPLEKDLYPIRVTARSASTSGIRGNPDAPVREDFRAVKLEEIDFEIHPSTTCVQPGEEKQFEALAANGNSVEVNWSTDNGRISNSGLYTGGSEGEAVITATLASDPEVSDSVTIGVGNCSCEFRAVLSGYRNEDITARTLKVTEEADLNIFGTADAYVDGSGALQSVELDGPFHGRNFTGGFLRGNRPSILAGNTGSFEVNGSASVGPWDNPDGGYTVHNGAPVWYDPDWQPLTLVISKFTEDYVIGRISGEVHDLVDESGPEPLVSFIDVEFQARTTSTGLGSNCVTY